MKKEFIIRSLKKIKKVVSTNQKLYEFGVDLYNYDTCIDILEEAIVLLFTNDDKKFECILNDVQWWLYEEVEKIIHRPNDLNIDVSDQNTSWIGLLIFTKCNISTHK
jgi:hypothetical protein